MHRKKESELTKEVLEAERQIKRGKTVSWSKVKRRRPSTLRGFVKGMKVNALREKRDRL